MCGLSRNLVFVCLGILFLEGVCASDWGGWFREGGSDGGFVFWLGLGGGRGSVHSLTLTPEVDIFVLGFRDDAFRVNEGMGLGRLAMGCWSRTGQLAVNSSRDGVVGARWASNGLSGRSVGRSGRWTARGRFWEARVLSRFFFSGWLRSPQALSAWVLAAVARCQRVGWRPRLVDITC